MTLVLCMETLEHVPRLERIGKAKPIFFEPLGPIFGSERVTLRGHLLTPSIVGLLDRTGKSPEGCTEAYDQKGAILRSMST